WGRGGAGDGGGQRPVEPEVMIRRQFGEARSASSVRSWSLFGLRLDESGGGDFILPSDSLPLSGLPFRPRSPCLLMSRPYRAVSDCRAGRAPRLRESPPSLTGSMARYFE